MESMKKVLKISEWTVDAGGRWGGKRNGASELSDGGLGCDAEDGDGTHLSDWYRGDMVRWDDLDLAICDSTVAITAFRRGHDGVGSLSLRSRK